MTVKSQVEQAVANAESLKGQLQMFAAETQQPEVKQMYEKMSKDLGDMLPHLKGRLGHIQDEEPQFH